MAKRDRNRRLVLRRETLRALEERKLGQVAGGKGWGISGDNEINPKTTAWTSCEWIC